MNLASWKGMTRVQVGRAPQLELTAEQAEKLKSDLAEEERVRQENIVYDKTTATEMMLAQPESREILRQFTSAVQSSFGRPIVVDELVSSERFGVFRDAKQEFERQPAIYKKLLDAIFPNRLRHSAPVNPLKPAVKAEETDAGNKGATGRRYLVITPEQARVHSTYVRMKKEAEAQGAILRIG